MAPLLAQRARSDRAFEKLYQRHVGDVYRYALVVMRNPADAEDVTQTTFMNAYRAFARGERPRTAQNWLIAIAHNVCRQRFRQQQRRPNELPLDEEVVEAVPEDDNAPTADDIRRALSHLALNQRAALVMRELEGRTYAEIAEVLEVSTSAVETLIFRARRALREQLEGSLTCTEAELAISRQLDGRLPRRDKGVLRAHLRECQDCARFARSQRAQRSAIKSLALIPIPSSLTSFFHHGSSAAAAGAGAAAGTGVAVKAALVGASALVATGVSVEAVRKGALHPLRKHEAAASVAPAANSATPAAVERARVSTLASPAASRKIDHPAAAEKQTEHQLAAKAKAHGRATAPGQLKAKPARPVKATKPLPAGLAEKPVRVAKPHKPKRVHAAGPGGSVLRPQRPKPPHPQPAPQSEEHGQSAKADRN
jgi:RNA polymerase sigma factor (sigma-70 family)